MRIDVCLATFERPALLQRLLVDLLAQELPSGVSMNIIVVDNDVLESARPVVAACQHPGIELDYLTQPERNIALTRNCALTHSQGEFIAFIDDDESAPAGWLATLLDAMHGYAADAVIGPVRGLLPENAPAWIANGRFFEPPALASGTRVRVGGTGNALVRAEAVRHKLAFDPRYGLTGGEDTDFFYRLYCTGAVMVWCQEAMVTETVPHHRLSLHYLLRRGFGAGQSYADIVDRPSGAIRLLVWLTKRALLTTFAVFLATACLLFSRSLAGHYAVKAATNLGQLTSVVDYRHQRYGRRMT